MNRPLISAHRPRRRSTLAAAARLFGTYALAGLVVSFIPVFIIALAAALHGYPQGLQP